MTNSYLDSVIKQFEYYKSLGDKTIHLLNIDELKKEFSNDSNSISIIVKHMAGNMLSRWTNFLTEDGEKEWRHRDEEFIESFETKEELLEYWQKGWDCLFNALQPLHSNQLEDIIYIRNQGHTITEGINRQMMHYAYHVGQITFIGKLIKGERWQSLSIPKGKSSEYNSDKFNQVKQRKHFTEDM
ncbi:MAG: DUF1572 family protein [Winogradskyella sp.]|uniref:DUF1572 family protein n=1 Tax=Winogradskyella sp. TaxID=1883156 RepID=UPI0025D53D23|nr:DUF1572 family protein [Winogradskyella sp.]NRB60505.1 DUF1572 family protein [Winogradskyella sp.]